MSSASPPVLPPDSAATSSPPTPPGRFVSRAKRSMAIMVVLSSLANAVNYASSLAFSRILEPVGFGELTSLLALSLVLAVPLGAAQTAVAERVAVANAAGDRRRIEWLVRHALGHVVTLGAIIGVLYIAAIPLVIEVLDIRQPGPAIALAPLVILTFLNPVTWGVLQGMERFAALGVVMFSVAFSRLLFGVPWALAGGGAGGAIAGQAIGLVAIHAITLWSLRKLILARGSGAATSGLRRRLDVSALSASGAFIGFAILSNLDVLLARLYLDSHDAGIYAAIATVAKVMIFLPATIATIMVPSAARAHAAEDDDSSRVLRLSGGATLAAGIACAIPALLFPGLIIQIMFSDGYEAAKSGVLPAVIAGAGLALLNLLCTYTVAIRDRRWLWLLAFALVLQVTAIGVFHGSPTKIAWAQAGTVVLVLVANELLLHSLVPRPKRAAA